MANVTAQLSRQPGRYLLSARDQHLVADASPARGGSGQGWSAQELLLAALLTCAQAVIEDEARQDNLDLRDLRLQADSQIDENRPGHYEWIRLELHFTGLTQAQAESLTGRFTTVCPIYGSLSRGAPLSVVVIATA